MRWFTGIALSDGLPELVPVLPIGSFKTAKYGAVNVTQAMAEEMVAHFAAGTLKTDVRFDIGHAFAEAAGWIRGLSIGTYPHPKTGEDMPAVVAEVEWTPEGEKLLADKAYRYVSAAYGPYKDEETGQVHKNVLHAVSITNDPVMKMLPALTTLAEDGPDGQAIAADVQPSLGERVRAAVSAAFDAVAERLSELGEVADEAERSRNAYPDAERFAAGNGIWDATAAFERLCRQAIAEGLEGEALLARFEELAADLPQALVESIQASVARANEGDAVEVVLPEETTPQVDPTQGVQLADLQAFDDLMEELEGQVGGKKGVREFRIFAKNVRKQLAAMIGVNQGKATAGGEEVNEEEARRMAEDAAAQREAEVRAEFARQGFEQRVDAMMNSLSERGVSEASRNAIRAALVSDGMVTLAEGQEVSRDEALVRALSEVEIVPQGMVTAASVQPAPQEDVQPKKLSEARAQVRKQLGTAEPE